MIVPPPVEMMYDGPAEAYVSNGLEFFDYFKNICGLKPNERMLDVGSGLGRKTIPLTDYLTTGSYEGIDCKRVGVEWCQQNISTVAPNFQFHHIDVQAPGYNPLGEIDQLAFKFPFSDREFDFVFLGSVFTHMGPGAILHYLCEIYRVLRPGGRCFITWFIADKVSLLFPHWHSYGWMANKTFPEEAIAYSTEFIMDTYDCAGLRVSEIKRGTWYNGEGLSYQDMILAEKEL